MCFPVMNHTVSTVISENSIAAQAGIKTNDRLNFAYPSVCLQNDSIAPISYYFTTDDKVIHSEYGEVQFTEYGLSGIPVFNASLYIDKELLDTKPFITVDFIPELSENQLVAKIKQILKEKRTDPLN